MRYIIFALFLSCFSGSLFAQEITEENYLKIDKQIWDEYEQRMDETSKYYQEHPDKRDSLLAIQDSIYERVGRLNREAAIKYSAVPSGLQRVFMVRNEIGKDTLSNILSSLPTNMRKSPYAKSIKQHIDTKQITEGDHFFDFKGKSTDNSSFKLSSIKNKNILLLYGGLGCMGESGREYLAELYKKTSRDDFEIIVYWPTCSSVAALKQIKDDYKVDYIFTSDFLEDHSPMKIAYGAQSMPTCFWIDKSGQVVMKTKGVDKEKLNALVDKLT